MAKIYTVWLIIKEIDEGDEHRQNIGELVELATFPTLEEAQAFQTELEQKYSPLATGEAALLEQMSTPEEFTPGD